VVRVLVVADTHIGLDHPLRPRSRRIHRGPELLASFRRALEPARSGDVDLVVHGGDLLHRSGPPAEIVRLALEPLLEVADAGVPVVLVPGNHERSALPMPMLALHPDLHVLDRPRTVVLSVRGLRIAIGGFPCLRHDARGRFPAELGATGLTATDADVRLLAIHQAFEGATVGPAGFTFRAGTDVVPGRAIPSGLAAVLAGHIHRRQRLDRDLAGRPLAAPVLYPGSTERTAFAERFEPKASLLATFEQGPAGGRLRSARFVELPTRPMEVVTLQVDGLDAASVEALARRSFAALPSGIAVQVRIEGRLDLDDAAPIAAASLRRVAPLDTVVEVRLQRPERPP